MAALSEKEAKEEEEWAAAEKAFHYDDPTAQEKQEIEFEEDWYNPFFQVYLQRRLKGTIESWREDIGVPPLVVQNTWNLAAEELVQAKCEDKHFLWLLTWMRRHTGLRGHARDWDTSKSQFYKKSMTVLETLIGKLGFVCPVSP